MLQKSLSSGIPFITSHVYHLQSAFKFNNLYFMTIQHIEKLVILENPAKKQQKESPFCCLQTILFSILMVSSLYLTK